MYGTFRVSFIMFVAWIFRFYPPSITEICWGSMCGLALFQPILLWVFLYLVYNSSYYTKWLIIPKHTLGLVGGCIVWWRTMTVPLWWGWTRQSPWAQFTLQKSIKLEVFFVTIHSMYTQSGMQLTLRVAIHTSCPSSLWVFGLCDCLSICLAQQAMGQRVPTELN